MTMGFRQSFVLKWLKIFFFSLLLIFILLLIVSQFIISIPANELRDFGSLYASGQAAAKGLNPYDVYPLTYKIESNFFAGGNPNLNPPPVVVVFEMISDFKPHTLFKIWWYCSVILFFLCLFLLFTKYHKNVTVWHLLLSLALPGVWNTFYLGQIYMPLLLFAILAWLFLEHDNNILAGLAIGILVSIKPNFLCWPAFLFLVGYRKTALTAIGAFVLFAMIPLALHGPQIYDQWFQLILNNDAKRLAFPTNISLSGIIFRSGMSQIAFPLSLIILIILSIMIWKRQPRAMETSALAISTSLLVSPIAWIHYTLFLLPVFFYKSPKTSMNVGFALFAFPLGFVFIAAGGPIWAAISIGSIYNWALLLVFTILVKQVFKMDISFSNKFFPF